MKVKDVSGEFQVNAFLMKKSLLRKDRWGYFGCQLKGAVTPLLQDADDMEFDFYVDCIWSGIVWESLFVDLVYGSIKNVWKFWNSWWGAYHVSWSVWVPSEVEPYIDGETRGGWLKRKVCRWNRVKTPKQRMATQRDEGAEVADA